MFNLPIFSKTKLLLSFEYGVILSDVAKQQGVTLTPEIIKRAEEMILSEFKAHGPTHLSTQIVPLILTVFELDISK